MHTRRVTVLALLLAGCGGGSGGGGTSTGVYTSLSLASASQAYEFGPADTLRLSARDQNGAVISQGSVQPVWTVTPMGSATVGANKVLFVGAGQTGPITISAQLTLQGITISSNMVGVTLSRAPAMQNVVVPNGQLAFSPSTAHIMAGGTVNWSGLIASHNVDFASITPFSGGTASKSGAPGSSDAASVTLNAVGTYSYTCDTHPGMMGSITVH
jgi:plastocyanin